MLILLISYHWTLLKTEGIAFFTFGKNTNSIDTTVEIPMHNDETIYINCGLLMLLKADTDITPIAAIMHTL